MQSAHLIVLHLRPDVQRGLDAHAGHPALMILVLLCREPRCQSAEGTRCQHELMCLLPLVQKLQQFDTCDSSPATVYACCCSWPTLQRDSPWSSRRRSRPSRRA